MSRYSAYLKRTARHFLRGNYGFFALALLCAALLSAIAAAVPQALFRRAENLPLYLSQLLIAFMISVLAGMLTDGLSRIALSVSREEEPSIRDLFFAFTHQADHFLVIELLLTGISGALHIPVLVMEVLARQELVSSLQFDLFSAVWGILEIVLAILLTLWFRLSVFLLLDHPEMSPVEAVRQSAALLKGRKKQFLYLEFSFTGMYLLCVLSAGIGFFWITPYYETTFALFYREVRGEIPVWRGG